MYCVKCGHLCKDGAKFCSKCGAPLSSTGKASDTKERESEYSAESGSFSAKPEVGTNAADIVSEPKAGTDTDGGNRKRRKGIRVAVIIVILAAAAVALFAIYSVWTGKHDSGDPETENIAEVSAEEENEPEEDIDDEPEEADDSWKQVYIDYINELTETEDEESEKHEYSLIYVDDNDIPELYATCMYMAEGDRICTVNDDGQIEEINLNRTGGSCYIERGGLISDYNGNMGYFILNLYSLCDGEFTDLYGDIGEVTIDMDEDGYETYTYLWEGDVVTEEQFYDNWDNIVDREEAKSVGEVTLSSSDEMIEILGGEVGTLDTYVDDVLIPSMGLVEDGVYFGKYNNPDNDPGYTGSILSDPIVLGSLLTSSMQDFDQDDEPELLVVLMREDDDEGITHYTAYLQMYEEENGAVVLKDEYDALCPVLGDGDEELSGIFLKESGGQIYICGSAYHNWYIADGITYNSFIVTYSNGKFVTEVSTDGTISGSDFTDEGDYKTESAEMAEFLEQIGLADEASQIRETNVRKFNFEDDEEMLMLVKGSPTGDVYTYYETGDIADLGAPLYILTLDFD